ncbi:LppX_LprAFG lipoprotein [Streptomyces phaeolivaceus]|uniref:LppX_LprAFG lipoprotein n=1 Tax=Streptomyces phaeolivaceus TaxID=2653200 RepID=A0A5P8KAW3_9ACTN|nr:LppX_LprAFG lipoprotein [Streptomyces phaeolivaceus]QFQ99767.1 LppX_LprAFG lipoprotein [Streptomyces phaeolivaceus]
MTSTRGRRRTVLSFAMAVALTGVAGCGPSDSGAGDGDPLAALRLADRATGDADSSRIESTADLGDLMSMTADGEIDWADGLHGTMTLTYTGGQAADRMSRLGITATEARYLPDAYYADMGEVFAGQYGGKRWIRYAYGDMDEMIGGAPGVYVRDHFASVTPNQSVRLLLASGDVERVGEEDVRGERTTHYAGTVRAESAEQLKAAGITTADIDLWIDDDHLLVKKVEKADTANGTVRSTVHYSDYGVDVSTEEPPAAETVDHKDLLSYLPTS